ncbi:MAG TPA: response regulator [Nitrospirae bacterium]|nr:response regulator [Nitrospirota bacterium]
MKRLDSRPTDRGNDGSIVDFIHRLYYRIMDDTKYCICCGEEVPFNVVLRNQRKELTCLYCGFTLDVENLWKEKDFGSERTALIAEDSRFTRTLLKKLITRKAIAGEVVAVTNGLELTSEFSRLAGEGRDLGFAIIDLNMPVMDGLTAARTIRAIEESLGIKKTPIIFFSSVKVDENLKSQMNLLSPAHYVNKGSDSDPEQLAYRVQALLNFITDRYRTG